ncbi:MAG: transcriptional repressor LexA [Rhodocyclaceae bacterium]|nr:MAG: transcriptional repressor LexA [Rhodocyclaceae bacterium]
MENLTPRQQEILDYIRNHFEVFSMPPTRAEIASAFGFASPNAAEDHLRALARKGAITLEAGSARGIRLVEQLGLPLIGAVAAGSPILAEENRQGTFRVDADQFSPRADYLLRVRGTSMVDAGILEGDLLAVHRCDDAANGQIVVVRLGDEVTVKRWKRRGNKVELIPENAAMKPIQVDLKQQPLAVEGLVVGVIRAGV